MLLAGFVFTALVAFWLGRIVERKFSGGSTAQQSDLRNVPFAKSPDKSEQHLHVYRPPVKAVLEYRDFNGTKSLRQVDVQQSLRKDDGTIYLKGFCHLRNEERTFRVDGIVSVATTDGEVLDLRQWLAGDLHIDLWARSLRAVRQQ